MRVTVGLRLKPLSSTNTRVAPWATFFFQLGSDGLYPSLNRLFVSFQRALLGFLRTETQLVEQLPHMVNVVPHLKSQPDHLPHAGGRPALIHIPRFLGAGLEHALELLKLPCAQTPFWSRCPSGLKTASLSEPLFPGPDRTF